MSTMKRRVILALQIVVLAAVLYWVFTAIAAQWSDVKTTLRQTDIQWRWIGLSSAMVLATYAMLVHSWRMLMTGWGSSLPYWTSVRIWTIANLGRYVPGKLWSIGALSVLAKREGVSGVAAAGAAILGTLLNIGAGFGIMAFSSAQTLGAISPWLQRVAILVSVAFVVGTLLLPRLLPPILRRVARWKGLRTIEQHLPTRTLWAATAINALSWLCYGAAFAMFARGITPQIVATPFQFVVIWTASYLSGYLFFLIPGGFGVRESVMIGGFGALGLAGTADATLLTAASRIWLTLLEIAPGLCALLLSRTTFSVGTDVREP